MHILHQKEKDCLAYRTSGHMSKLLIIMISELCFQLLHSFMDKEQYKKHQSVTTENMENFVINEIISIAETIYVLNHDT